MKCPNCDSENSDTAKFCKKCGQPLKKKEIDHSEMISKISKDKTSSSNNNTKLIIIALAIVAVVLAGAFAYMYAFNDSGSSSSQTSDASSSVAEKNDDSNTGSSEKTAESSSSSSSSKTSSMTIRGGSFSTGSAEEDKTYATINVGTEYAGESVIVQILYSRDGNSLNNGNMVPANVHSDGYLYITSADAYHYYPDYATIKLYDSNSNLLDTQSVSLSPTSGKQTF